MSSTDVSTDLFNVSRLSDIFIEMSYSTDSPSVTGKLAYFTENEAVIQVVQMGDVTEYSGTVPTNAYFARIGLLKANFTGLTIRETEDGDVIGELSYP